MRHRKYRREKEGFEVSRIIIIFAARRRRRRRKRREGWNVNCKFQMGEGEVSDLFRMSDSERGDLLFGGHFTQASDLNCWPLLSKELKFNQFQK